MHARSQLSSAGNQISLLTVSSPGFIWGTCHKMHLSCHNLYVSISGKSWGDGRCIRGDRCGPSRRIWGENGGVGNCWWLPPTFKTSSPLTLVTPTSLLSSCLAHHHHSCKKCLPCKISTLSCHLGHWVWERRNNPGLRKSAYYTRDGVGSRSSHPSLVLGLPGEIVEDAAADKANHNLVPSLSVPLTPTQ